MGRDQGVAEHPDASRSSFRIANLKALVKSGWTSHEKKVSVSSVDSFGDYVLPRIDDVSGWIQKISISDFVAVKTANDIILVIAEIKLQHGELTSSIH